MTVPWQSLARIRLSHDAVRLPSRRAVWKWALRLEKLRLWVALHGHAIDIQHIGSAAVLDLHAKSRIDNCVALAGSYVSEGRES